MGKGEQWQCTRDYVEGCEGHHHGVFGGAGTLGMLGMERLVAMEVHAEAGMGSMDFL